jgi:hypothetical protein
MKHVPIAVLIFVKFTLKNKPAKVSEASDYSLHVHVHGAIDQKQDACFCFAACWNQSDAHVPEMQT